MTTVVVIIAVVVASVLLAVWASLDPPPRDQPAREPLPDYAAIARMEREVYGEKPGPDLDALTPFPVGTGWLEPVPDDDPPDITTAQPPAVCYLGQPVDQYLDELFGKPAEAQQ